MYFYTIVKFDTLFYLSQLSRYPKFVHKNFLSNIAPSNIYNLNISEKNQKKFLRIQLFQICTYMSLSNAELLDL